MKEVEDDNKFEVWIDWKNEIVSFHEIPDAEQLNVDRETFFTQYIQYYFKGGYKFQ